MSVSDVITARIRAQLTKQLTILAGDLADKARQNASWSSTIPNAISVGSVQSDGSGRMYIDVTVDLNKAPSAAAFEYGSGVHRKDDPQPYKIEPREDGPGYLAFPASRWPNFQPPPNVNVITFPGPISNKAFVMHPGVAARPYMAPAVRASRRSIRGMLLRVFKMGYIEAIPRITIIEASK